MKNKLLIAILFNFLCLVTVCGQNWFSENDKWTSKYFDWSLEGYETMEVIGDSMIANTFCKVLERRTVYVDQSLNLGDTLYGTPILEFVFDDNNKIYWYNKETGNFDKIYDFSLLVGDTLSIPINECEIDLSYRIDAIGTIMIDNVMRITQDVTVFGNEPYYSEHNVQIIESIGMVSNPGYVRPHQAYLCFTDGPAFFFRCFENNDFSYNPIGDNCTELPTSIFKLEINDQLTVSPNPVIDELTIKSEAQESIEQIELYSINGQILMQRKGGSSQEIIDLQQFQKGIYILKIKSDNDYYIKKIIK